MRIRHLTAAAATTAVLAIILIGCYPSTLRYHWAPEVAPSVAQLQAQFGINAITYPGHDPDEAHAADFMLPGAGHNAAWVTRGYALANYARTNNAWLHVHYIVYRQHIWNIERNADGWRLMPSRGNWTQNHMDHFHISFY